MLKLFPNAEKAAAEHERLLLERGRSNNVVELVRFSLVKGYRCLALEKWGPSLIEYIEELKIESAGELTVDKQRFFQRQVRSFHHVIFFHILLIATLVTSFTICDV